MEGSVDLLFYWTGVMVWLAVAGTVGGIFLLELWNHTSIGAALWYAIVKTDGVKDEYRKKRFYRVRLLGHMLVRPWKTWSYQGTTLRTNNFSANFTGWVPRITIYDKADDATEVGGEC